MITYKLGGKKGEEITLKESDDRVVVRTKNARKLDDAVSSKEGKKALKNFEVELEFPRADVTILKTKKKVTSKKATRNEARTALKEEEELRFAGRVLEDSKSKTPVLYTENLFVKFHDNIKEVTCEQILSENNLNIKQKLDYAINSYFVSAPDNTGLKVFEIANALLQRSEVELCHPELIRKRSSKTINTKQWHLKETKINNITINAHVNIEKAHQITKGENIVIAVIDDGVDIDHQEFNASGKVVHSRDVTYYSNDPRPKSMYDKHGTSCAGVAAASGINSSGVAPDAKLMPIRSVSNLGSIEEANAFKWAADHGADVISCSWGPEDGDWDVPGDPLHFQKIYLPDSTRLAIDYAVTQGRNGKGCVITFAAGNGNESVENDGYASYDKVIAVAACNDTNKRSVYSDYGSCVLCSFPSNDFRYSKTNHPAPKTKGIYTTDRKGSSGYSTGDYTEMFGGTSSSCPGVAGIAALILSANPELTGQQVREVIKNSCVKIDISNGNYNNTGHSDFYGYGRPDAFKAVTIAKSMINVNNNQTVKIISALINPSGIDAGSEKISILNESANGVNLDTWYIEVKGRKQYLSGQLGGGNALTINLDTSKLRLANTGATINLFNSDKKKIHGVNYNKKQVKSGKVLLF